MWKLLLFCLASLVSESLQSENCNDGPSYWCLNTENAKKCGAINYCKFEYKVSSQVSNESDSDAAPVQVALYYESLCPDCKQIFQYQIWPAFERLKNTGILKLKFVPYGNAQQRFYGNQWYFYCQHGQAECTGNLIETCAIYHNPNMLKHVPFLHCMEYYGPTARNLQYCAGLAGIDYNTISSCMQGQEGNKAQHEMGVQTESLNPPHRYVPWFTLNGYHSDNIQNQLSSNFLNFVCQSYTGTKPKECYADEKVKGCLRNDFFSN